MNVVCIELAHQVDNEDDRHEFVDLDAMQAAAEQGTDDARVILEAINRAVAHPRGSTELTEDEETALKEALYLDQFKVTLPATINRDLTLSIDDY